MAPGGRHPPVRLGAVGGTFINFYTRSQDDRRAGTRKSVAYDLTLSTFIR